MFHPLLLVKEGLCPFPIYLCIYLIHSLHITVDSHIPHLGSNSQSGCHSWLLWMLSTLSLTCWLLDWISQESAELLYMNIEFKCFFCTYACIIFLLFSLMCQTTVIGFLIKQTLHSWDKYNLAMVYYLHLYIAEFDLLTFC